MSGGDGIVLPQGEDEMDLKEGKEYEAALLSIDAAGHGELARLFELDAFMSFLDAYHRHVQDVVSRYGGEEWQWAGDGGLFVFLGEGCHRAAAMAGMMIVNTWRLFEYDAMCNPLQISMSLRLAASAGPMRYREPRSKVFADCINRAVHMQEDVASPDEFVLDESLWSEFPESLQRVFRLKEYSEGRKVYRYLPQTPGQRPENAAVEALIEDVREQVEEVLRLVPGGADPGDNELSWKINHKSSKIYASLRQFAHWVRHPEDVWSEHYLWRLAAYTEQLLKIEAGLWDGIREWHALLSPDIRSEGLLSLQKHLAALHGAIAETDFAHLKQQFELLARKAACGEVPGHHPVVELREPSEELVRLAQRFAATDEMGALACFIPLADRPVEELHAVLGGNFPRREAFVTRLGSMPDLVLTEDLARGIRPGADGGLFASLCRSREVGTRLSVLAGLLEDLDLRPFEEDIGRIFRGHGLPLDVPELTCIQRAILVAHADLGIRYQAAEVAPLDELWQPAVYQKTPLHTLAVIARRLPEWEDDHLKMIFFDVVKSRLAAAVREVSSIPELRMMTEFLELFFQFDCFITNAYFTPLAEMVAILSRKASELGRTVSLAGWKGMVEKSITGRFIDHPEPLRVERLPQPVQRYLARLGFYATLFACSRLHRVANEMASHIHAKNISTFLLQEQLNRSLLTKLLKREELFKEPEPLLLALSHPRCHPGLAVPYLKRLIPQQMEHVLNCATTNTDVKTQAWKLIVARR